MLIKTQVGDLKGFIIEIIKNILYLIGVGYFGGSIMAISTNKEFRDEAFPINTDKLPYQVGRGQEEVNGEGVLEYMFPMKRLGFPYSYLSKESDSVVSEYKNWLIYTCIYSFSTIRLIFLKFYDICSHFTTGCKRTIGFYAFPYILIGFMGTIFPYLLFIIPFIGSLSPKEINHPSIFTFSMFIGWLYPLYNKQPIRFATLFIMILLQAIMFFTTIFIQLPWWGCIMAAVYVYSFVIVLFSPFLIKDGLKHVFKEIGHHTQSLTLYFLYLTMYTSIKYLTQPISIGLGIGSLYVAYKVLFPKKTK
jgi:hypothetical protein